MDHLPYIVAAYGIGAATIAWFSLDALLRMRRARRRLLAVDPRASR